MKWFKRLSIAACALLISSVVWAADDTDLTVTESNFGDKWYKEVVWFDTYDLGNLIGVGQYVYNDASGTNSANTDGLVEVRKYNLKRTIQVDMTVMGSDDVDVRLEGRAGTGTSWMSLGTVNFPGSSTLSAHIGTSTQDVLVEEFRVGIKANGTDNFGGGSLDQITITGIFLGDGR